MIISTSIKKQSQLQFGIIYLWSRFRLLSKTQHARSSQVRDPQHGFRESSSINTRFGFRLDLSSIILTSRFGWVGRGISYRLLHNIMGQLKIGSVSNESVTPRSSAESRARSVQFCSSLPTWCFRALSRRSSRGGLIQTPVSRQRNVLKTEINILFWDWESLGI